LLDEALVIRRIGAFGVSRMIDHVDPDNPASALSAFQFNVLIGLAVAGASLAAVPGARGEHLAAAVGQRQRARRRQRSLFGKRRRRGPR
jgi:hypothetical protein